MSKQTQEAAVKPQKAPLSIDPKYIGRLVGTLTGICLVTALLLGIVNQVTKPRIDALQKAKQETAMRNVLAAEEYIPWEGNLRGQSRQPCDRPLSGKIRRRGDRLGGGDLHQRLPGHH